MSSTNHHLLLICVTGWGHAIPGLAYAIRLLQETSHLTITFPVSGIFFEPIHEEISQYISDAEDPVRKRLRVVPVGEIVLGREMFPVFFTGLYSFCTDLFTSKPYQQANGTVLPPIQPPDVCLLDVVFWDLLCFIRSLNPKTPILSLCPANVTGAIFTWGPEELGGKGDIPTKAELLAKETGKPIDDIYTELYTPSKGQIADLIGLPKLYDYECHIKPSPATRSVITGMYPKIYMQFRDCDGIVSTNTRIYEPESHDALKAWFEGSGRSHYVVGPRALTSDQFISKQRSTDRDAVEKFLDQMLQKHGEKSIIYVSFGSYLWPLDPEATWRAFEIINEMQIPMILVHNEARPPIPDTLRAKFEASDIVLISKWAPQNLVLNHKATGWFLTHCGQNSVLEALSHGIPMIAWPIEADQIMNSVYVGEHKHNVGYELLEVQHRDETQPLYRGYTPSGTLDAIEKELRTVLKKAVGPDGAEKRRNAEIFKEKISHSWDENGEARLEMRRFIKDYLS